MVQSLCFHWKFLQSLNSKLEKFNQGPVYSNVTIVFFSLSFVKITVPCIDATLLLFTSCINGPLEVQQFVIMVEVGRAI